MFLRQIEFSSGDYSFTCVWEK